MQDSLAGRPRSPTIQRSLVVDVFGPRARCALIRLVCVAATPSGLAEPEERLKQPTALEPPPLADSATRKQS
jgi:hypothetical protein